MQAPLQCQDDNTAGLSKARYRYSQHYDDSVQEPSANVTVTVELVVCVHNWAGGFCSCG